VAAKILFFAKRSPSLRREEFQRTYLTEHARGPLEHFPKLTRYVVNVVDVDWQPKIEHPLADTDVVAEMWFEELGDFMDRARRFDSSETYIAMQEEAQAFFGDIVAYHVRPGIQRDYDRTWQDGQRSPGVKMVYPVQRKPDLSREQFAEHWLTKHVPIVLEYMNGVSRYVTNVVERPIGKAPEADGFVELHYLDPAALEGPRYNSPKADAIMAADVAQFITPTGLALRCSEYILRS
jgi:uncharacterized protein (TIGR02118 family)